MRVELIDAGRSPGAASVDVFLEDAAEESVTDHDTPLSGFYRPAEPLERMSGRDADGTWTLEVTDETSDDGGALVSWSLDIGVYQPTDEFFVDGLYEDGLDRDADLAEIDFWADQIDDPGDRLAVADQILGSDEAHAAATRDLYQTYLRRDAAADEVAFWVNYRQTNEAEQQLAQILASDEYYTMGTEI
jgi:hypothetical protein